MSSRIRTKPQPKRSATKAVKAVKVCDFPPLDRQIGKVLAGSMAQASKKAAKASFVMVVQTPAGYDVFPARPDTLQEYLDAEPTLLFIPKQAVLGPAATVGPIAALFKIECVRGKAIFDNTVYRSMLAKFEAIRWSSLLHHGTSGVDVKTWRSKKANKALLTPKTAKSLVPKAKAAPRSRTGGSKRATETTKDRLLKIFDKIMADCEKSRIRDCNLDSKQTLNVTGYPDVMPKAKTRAANPKVILNYEGSFLCSSDPDSVVAAMIDLHETGRIEGELEFEEESEEESVEYSMTAEHSEEEELTVGSEDEEMLEEESEGSEDELVVEEESEGSEDELVVEEESEVSDEISE